MKVALAAMAVYFIIGIIGMMLFQSGALVWWLTLLVGVIAYCTRLIVAEIDGLRREIRGEAPPPSEPPLSERLTQDRDETQN